MRAVVRNHPLLALLTAALAGAAVVLALWGGTASAPGPRPDAAAATAAASETPTAAPTRTPTATASPPREIQPGVACDPASIVVATAEELTEALAAAQPGDRIRLAAGTYVGNFVAETSGTALEPISLCGSAESVLDGDDESHGYVLHLNGASYWQLTGFTITNGQKGLMADTTIGSVISNLTVHHIGDEAIHLRKASTDNTISENTISDTGLRKQKFGEGIYIGSAESNWCDISDCSPDLSDRNLIENNTISNTTSESIDVKEGTSDGVIRGNSFDGESIVEADSWVDIKGNGWLIEGNTGSNSLGDGFQTHEILEGWGTDNIFRDNVAEVNGPGFGYSLTPQLRNTVECNNTAFGAGEGFTNHACTG